MTDFEDELLIDTARGFSKDGKWFKDSHNRYLLFRGVNFGSRSKLPPYLPIARLETTQINLEELKQEIESISTDLDRLKEWGFNIVRLLVSWKALEPYPNKNLEDIEEEGKQYLVLIKEIIDSLYSRGIYVILDFHQDIAHEIYGGDGFPDWALAVDGKNKLPKPSNLRDKKWQMAYMINKSVRHTLKSFWQNDLTNDVAGIKNFPVRTHLEKTIGQTVKFFKTINNNEGHPAILGIEPFNEPHPVGIDPEKFEQEFLYKYYLSIESEVRSYDDRLFVFMEPRVDWTVSEASNSKSLMGKSIFSAKRTFNLGFIRNAMVDGKIEHKEIRTNLPSERGLLKDISPRGVLSFHYYDIMAIAGSYLKIPENLARIKRLWPDIFAQLVEAAEERDFVPFLTEFGGLQDAEQIRDYLDINFNQIESFLLNSTLWNYDLYNTEEGKDNWNLENYSILGPGRNPRNIDVVVRPYPMRSSAEPIVLFFDHKSKYSALILKGEPLQSYPTVIYVPSHIHYSPEFAVWATSKRVRWNKENQLLYWYPDSDQRLNQLILGKPGELNEENLPNKSKSLLSNTVLVGTFSG